MRPAVWTLHGHPAPNGSRSFSSLPGGPLRGYVNEPNLKANWACLTHKPLTERGDHALCLAMSI